MYIVPGLDGTVGVPDAFVDVDTLDVMADGIREEVVFAPLVVILSRPFKRNLCHQVRPNTNMGWKQKNLTGYI